MRKSEKQWIILGCIIIASAILLSVNAFAGASAVTITPQGYAPCLAYSETDMDCSASSQAMVADLACGDLGYAGAADWAVDNYCPGSTPCFEWVQCVTEVPVVTQVPVVVDVAVPVEPVCTTTCTCGSSGGMMSAASLSAQAMDAGSLSGYMDAASLSGYMDAASLSGQAMMAAPSVSGCGCQMAAPRVSGYQMVAPSSLSGYLLNYQSPSLRYQLSYQPCVMAEEEEEAPAGRAGGGLGLGLLAGWFLGRNLRAGRRCPRGHRHHCH